jgi:hypothetical protein
MKKLTNTYTAKLSDSDLVGDSETVYGWPKNQGETEALVHYNLITQDDTFLAPYQDGSVRGGSVYKEVGDMQVMLADKDITNLLTKKALDSLRSKINSNL